MNNDIKASSAEEDEIDLLQLFTTILEGKWLILFVTSLALIGAVIFAFGQPNVYRADASLQVEEKASTVPGLEELAGLSGEQSSVETEIELLKSRMILGKVVERLKLDIVVSPKRVPLLGLFYQHFFSPDDVKKPQIWERLDKITHSYSWGSELINVTSLSVPKALLNKSLTLTVGDKEGHYQLFNDKDLLLEGVVGKLSSSKDRTVKIYVKDLKGQAGTNFIVTKLSKLTAVKGLQTQLKVSEKGKKTGIIQLQMDSTNKDQIVDILNRLSHVYLQKSLEYSTEEAGKALIFLEEQIKPLKEKLAAADSALSQYRTRNQTANMSAETVGVLETVAAIETELQQLLMQKASLSQRYTYNHPSMKVLVSQEAALQKRKQKMLSKVVRLPKKQQDLLKLERDYKVTDAIYFKVLNDIQEFKIAKASKIGNIRIVDSAVAYDQAVKPKRSLILALGGLLGLMLGTMLVFVRSMLHKTIEDPKVLEQSFNIPVFTTVPLNKKLNKSIAKGKRGRKQKNLLALQDPNNLSIESLRSLRTSLQFTLFEAKNNIVMVTGPSPSVGKSFISSNFAAVLGVGDKRVLLIDADMRKGYLHEVLRVPASPGLSELISGKCEIDEAVHTISLGEEHSMDILTGGVVPPNPSELLMNSRFSDLLNRFSDSYDLVIIDTPPINAVTDPSIIGVLSGVVFMVVHNNHHTVEEIELAISRLSHTGVVVNGFIYNGHEAKGKYGYYSYGYN